MILRWLANIVIASGVLPVSLQPPPASFAPLATSTCFSCSFQGLDTLLLLMSPCTCPVLLAPVCSRLLQRDQQCRVSSITDETLLAVDIAMLNACSGYLATSLVAHFALVARSLPSWNQRLVFLSMPRKASSGSKETTSGPPCVKHELHNRRCLCAHMSCSPTRLQFHGLKPVTPLLFPGLPCPRCL